MAFVISTSVHVSAQAIATTDTDCNPCEAVSVDETIDFQTELQDETFEAPEVEEPVLLDEGVEAAEPDFIVDDGELQVYPSLSEGPTILDDTPVEITETIDFAEADNGVEGQPSNIDEVVPTAVVYDDGAPEALPSVATPNLSQGTGGGQAVEMAATPRRSERETRRTAAVEVQGNACLDRRTYVSWLCAWQGFPRP